jgi:arabinosaccharide transport system substrate-binding protein
LFRQLIRWADDFPPGRVPLLLIILAVGSGGAILLRGSLERTYTLDIWTFTHIAVEEFGARLKDHPQRDQIRLQNLGAAMFDRLALSVMTQTELPDLVEIEQSQVGRYFRGPIEHLPFVDLTDRIQSEGWDERVVKARFARYSIGGRLFGVPHDIHPMVLVYNPAALAELGATPDDLATWDSFAEVAQRFHQLGALGTETWRSGLALSVTEGYDFLTLLWQRGGDVFAADGSIILNNELGVDTLRFYMSLLYSDPPIAGRKLSALSEDFAALARGQFLAYPAPDWMLASMQLDMRDYMFGKVKIMPLPAWEAGGRQTSTGGGTAIFIPRGTQDVDAAWEMLKLLYFDRASHVKRFRDQSIVPPLKEAFSDPAFSEPSPFFMDQQVGLVLTRLADQVPPIQGSPYLSDAFTLLNARASDTYKQAEASADKLRAAGGAEQEINEAWRGLAQAMLDTVAAELAEIIARDQRAIEKFHELQGAGQ